MMNDTLAHHFDTPAQQYDSARLGMWIFLMTEVLFFGGLFCAYAVYRAIHPAIFLDGHWFLDKPLGAANTVVLILSSLTMALAVRAAQRGQRRAPASLLAATILCGLVFLGVKGVEYRHKWERGMVPGQARIAHWLAREPGPAPTKEFRPDKEYVAQCLARAGRDNLAPAELDRRIAGLGTFMGIYFSLTALHALHVLAGLIALAWVLAGALKGRFGSHYFTPVDLVGLYWHLVDIIWIFLFPLLYLIH